MLLGTLLGQQGFNRGGWRQNSVAAIGALSLTERRLLWEEWENAGRRRLHLLPARLLLFLAIRLLRLLPMLPLPMLLLLLMVLLMSLLACKHLLQCELLLLALCCWNDGV